MKMGQTGKYRGNIWWGGGIKQQICSVLFFSWFCFLFSDYTSDYERCCTCQTDFENVWLWHYIMIKIILYQIIIWLIIGLLSTRELIIDWQMIDWFFAWSINQLIFNQSIVNQPINNHSIINYLKFWSKYSAILAVNWKYLSSHKTVSAITVIISLLKTHHQPDNFNSEQ